MHKIFRFQEISWTSCINITIKTGTFFISKQPPMSKSPQQIFNTWWTLPFLNQFEDVRVTSIHINKRGNDFISRLESEITITWRLPTWEISITSLRWADRCNFLPHIQQDQVLKFVPSPPHKRTITGHMEVNFMGRNISLHNIQNTRHTKDSRVFPESNLIDHP